MGEHKGAFVAGLDQPAVIAQVVRETPPVVESVATASVPPLVKPVEANVADAPAAGQAGVAVTLVGATNVAWSPVTCAAAQALAALIAAA